MRIPIKVIMHSSDVDHSNWFFLLVCYAFLPHPKSHHGVGRGEVGHGSSNLCICVTWDVVKCIKEGRTFVTSTAKSASSRKWRWVVNQVPVRHQDTVSSFHWQPYRKCPCHNTALIMLGTSGAVSLLLHMFPIILTKVYFSKESLCKESYSSTSEFKHWQWYTYILQSILVLALWRGFHY